MTFLFSATNWRKNMSRRSRTGGSLGGSPNTSPFTITYVWIRWRRAVLRATSVLSVSRAKAFRTTCATVGAIALAMVPVRAPVGVCATRVSLDSCATNAAKSTTNRWTKRTAVSSASRAISPVRSRAVPVDPKGVWSAAPDIFGTTITAVSTSMSVSTLGSTPASPTPSASTLRALSIAIVSVYYLLENTSAFDTHPDPYCMSVPVCGIGVRILVRIP